MREMEVEQRVERVERWQQESEKRFEADIAKMDMYIEKTDETIKQQREDMRHMNEKIDRLSDKIDGIGRSVQNLSIAAMAGIGAMAVSIIVFVGAAIYRG